MILKPFSDRFYSYHPVVPWALIGRWSRKKTALQTWPNKMQVKGPKGQENDTVVTDFSAIHLHNITAVRRCQCSIGTRTLKAGEMDTISGLTVSNTIWI